MRENTESLQIGLFGSLIAWPPLGADINLMLHGLAINPNNPDLWLRAAPAKTATNSDVLFQFGCTEGKDLNVSIQNIARGSYAVLIEHSFGRIENPNLNLIRIPKSRPARSNRIIKRRKPTKTFRIRGTYVYLDLEFIR